MTGQSCWCVTGATGALGSCLVRRLQVAGKEPLLGVASRPRAGSAVPLVAVDLADSEQVCRSLASHPVDVWLHTAAVTSIAAAIRDPRRAVLVNVEATRLLVEVAAARDARFVFCSTDLVFDGRSPPYDESATPAPINHYGRTKLVAESIVSAYQRGVVVRLPLMYGFPAVPRRTSFVEQVSAMRSGQRLRLFTDEFRTPIWLEDAAAALQAVGESEVTGILHVGGPQRLSRWEMGVLMAEVFGFDGACIEPGAQADAPNGKSRPADVSLVSGQFVRLFGHVPRRTMTQALAEMAAADPAIPEWV